MNIAQKSVAGMVRGLLLLVFAGLAAPDAAAQMFVRDFDDPSVQDGGDSYGCSLVDVNNDGFPDLYVSNEGTTGTPERNFFYLNDGAGNFLDADGFAITAQPGMSQSGLWADMNNDGFLDLYVVNRDYQHNFYFINIGPETATVFQEVTTGPHVNDAIDESVFAGSSVDGDIGDYDLDGFLDLVVANRDNERNFLFHNSRGEGFTRVQGLDITEDRNESRGCSWIDLDDDGDLDLYVFNDREANIMYRNNGKDWTRRLGGALPLIQGRARGVAWGDYNNDGRIDALLVHSNEYNILYRNVGSGFFAWESDALPSNEGGECVSAAWGDYDNDADLDLIISNTGDLNFLYRNDAGTFTRVTDEPMTQNVGSSTGIAWADIDNDGFLDLYISNRDGENNELYRNQGNGNNWVKVALRGFGSNRFGVGSVVRVRAEIGGETVEQMRVISVRSGPISQSCMEACFGLGDAERITDITVEFPSGDVVTLDDMAVNTRHVIEESPSTSVDAPLFNSDIALSITPHPLTAQTASARIEWTQADAGPVEFSLFARDGRLMLHRSATWFEAGSASLDWSELNAENVNIPAGVYLLRINANGTAHDAALVVAAP